VEMAFRWDSAQTEAPGRGRAGVPGRFRRRASGGDGVQM